MKTQPVLTAAGLSGFVTAFLAMAVALGWISLTPEQTQAVQAVVIPLAVFLVPLAGAWWAHNRVVPVAKLPAAAQAQLQAGEPVDPSSWNDDEALPTGYDRKELR